MKKAINILDLSELMTAELQGFLESFNVHLVHEDESFSHILISNSSDIDDAKYAGKKIISLDKPLDYQAFYKQGGSFYLNPEWIQTVAGKHIVTRYFQGEASSLFSENFPNYQRSGSFNVTNIIGTGEFIDRLAFAASDAGASAFDIKTGFSHLLVYLSRLSDQAIGGLPFEVNYGDCKKDFVIQVHLNATGLSVESIVEALDEKFDRHSKFQGLFFAFKSCDLMEISYVESASKLTISMHWLESVFVDEPGLILNMASKPVLTKVDMSLSDTLALNETKVISGVPDDEDDLFKIEGVTQIFKDESTLIEDHEELDNFVMKIKGKFEDLADKTKTVVKGSKIDVDDVIYKIAGNVEEVISESKFLIRPLEKNIVKALRSELKEYSQTISTPVEDFSSEEIARFQVQKMPEIIRRELSQPISKEEIPESVILKRKIESLTAEVQVLKESKKVAEEIKIIASASSNDKNSEASDLVLEVKKRTNISEADFDIIKSNFEKEFEKKAKRLEVEAQKKEALFSREIEKVKHQLHIKDVTINNTKEGLAKILNKKDEKLASLQSKIDQLTAVASLNSMSTLSAQFRDSEKHNNNLTKQVEIYKNQISELGASRNNQKVDQEQKEQIRQLKVICEKLKTMLNSTKAELDHVKFKSAVAIPGQVADKHGDVDQEFQRTQIQNKQLEIQLKDSAQKVISLEAKLVELSRSQQRPAADDGSRVRIGQLEASVKKLTLDVTESKTQLMDSKKEINRLRSEKTSIQNQLDKVKKEAERSKAEAAKKASKAS